MKRSSVHISAGILGFILGASFSAPDTLADGSKPDDKLIISGFSIEISGTDTGSFWESVTGGALNIEVADGSPGVDQVQTALSPPKKYIDTLILRGALRSTGKTSGSQRCAVAGSRDQVHPRKRRVGGVNFQAVIEGMPILRSELTLQSITIEDLVIDEEELSGADPDYRAYSPGDAHYGSITIRTRVGKNSRELHDWWQAGAKGKGSGRNVTVTALGCDDTVKRQYKFSQCIPSSYQPHVLKDLPQVALEAITVRCNGFDMAAEGNAMVLAEWINATVRGQEQGHDVTVREITRNGADGRTFEYLDAFPTRYVFPKLDANSAGSVYEEISIRPNRLELY